MLHEMMHALGFWHEQVDLLHSAVHTLIGIHAMFDITDRPIAQVLEVEYIITKYIES